VLLIEETMFTVRKFNEFDSIVPLTFFALKGNEILVYSFISFDRYKVHNRAGSGLFRDVFILIFLKS
jgi:hypothetical protein